MKGYFHSFLPVNSQITTKITAITSKICISAPTPGKAKNPTSQSIKITIAIVNQVFITYQSPKYTQNLNTLLQVIKRVKRL